MRHIKKKERVHFDNIQYHILQSLRSCQTSLKVCVAWISWDVYGPHFRNLAARGVAVEIMYNNDQKNLRASLLEGVDGITLYPINARRYSSLMHNKFCIIDDEMLLTGSFNWSVTAETHFENIVILNSHYELINEFKHEFEDLKAYFSSYKNPIKTVCNSDENGDSFRCRSHTYNIGILGEASGIHEQSTVHVWRVCNTYKHAEKISESEEIFLMSNLLESYDYDDSDEDYDQSTMQVDFSKQRKKIKNIVSYFKNRHGVAIHAVGRVAILNENEYMHYNEPAEYGLHMMWRDMYYRKIIPQEFYECESEGIEEIISDSKNSVDYAD